MPPIPLAFISGGIVSTFNDVIVPYVGANGNNRYLHTLKLDGSVTGSYLLSASSALNQQTQIYHRYLDKLYVFPRYDSITYYLIDLTKNSITTHAIAQPSFTGHGQWSRFSPTELIKVSSADSAVYIFSLSANTFSTQSPYNAGTTTAIAQTHGTTTFYSKSSSGLTNFGSLVAWTAANTDQSPYDGETNTATYGLYGLGGRSTTVHNENYSRNTGMASNAYDAYMAYFDGATIRKISSTGTITTLTPTRTLTYNALSYTFRAINYEFPALMTSNRKLYGVYYYAGGGLPWSFALAYWDFTSTNSPSPVFVRTLTASQTSDYFPASLTMVEINDAGYVAVAHPSFTNAQIVEVKVYSGSTLITSSSATLPANTYGINVNVGVNPQSEFAKYYSLSGTSN